MGCREGRGHFHVAAGQAEVVRPEGVLATPVDRATQHIFKLAHEDVLVDLVL
ncbi:hypothetical protein D3C81_1845800 [compost metagenome]